MQRLNAGPGLPFVTIESSLLRSLSIIPEPVIPTDIASRPNRIFELRIYQSQSMTAL